ncbi:MAG: translation initiation factor IF-3 [Myxococcales bacterium]|nr:translation initiation factor IF-3 [Myxococcales bacterium]
MIRKGPRRGDRRRPRELYRVNHRIRVPEVRVVLEDGEQLGIMSRDDALATAREKGLDLVEITARAKPPVCRIMDYGRFKYEQSKKAKAAKKHASTVELKEIKFRPKTDEHDLAFKIKHVTRFLEEGNKCRLVVIFRGREVVHPKTGLAVLDRVKEATKELSQVEVRPNLEGKRMVMIIGPKAGIQKRSKSSTDGKTKSKKKSKNKTAAPEAAEAAPAVVVDSEAKAAEEAAFLASQEAEFKDDEDDTGADSDAGEATGDAEEPSVEEASASAEATPTETAPTETAPTETAPAES